MAFEWLKHILNLMTHILSFSFILFHSGRPFSHHPFACLLSTLKPIRFSTNITAEADLLLFFFFELAA